MRRLLLFTAVVIALAGGLVAVTSAAKWLEPATCEVTVEGRSVQLRPEQAEHATTITLVGIQRGLPARAVSIALATAYQESKLRNLDYGDRDSVGLFQQRPSQGWGSVAEIMDPIYAANQFFAGLEKVDGYQNMRITEAAQAVQRSAFPEAYEDHAEDARALASALTGYSAERLACTSGGTAPGPADTDVLLGEVERAYGAPVGKIAAGMLTVEFDPSDETKTRRAIALAQYLMAHSDRLGVASVGVADQEWTRDDDSGWNSAQTEPGRLRAVLQN